MVEEKFDFSAGLKKKLIIVAAIGVLFLIVGSLLPMGGGHEEAADEQHTETTVAGEHSENTSHDEEGNHEKPEAEHSEGEDHENENPEHNVVVDGHEVAEVTHGGTAGHSEVTWFKRFKVDFWINNVYFIGLALIGMFFFTLQYASQAGWSAAILRVPLSMAHWLPIAGILLLLSFILFGSDIFHWTADYLYDHNDPGYDHLIDGKKGFFFGPGASGGGIPWFFYIRLVGFFSLWIYLFRKLKGLALQEDEIGGVEIWAKMRKFSAIFLIIFAVSSSISAWDWIMSIDTHWYSTMFGWYVFASWWVSGLAFITLVIVFLKEAGYLPMVNMSVLHDLGKLVFAFSVFWCYIWFSQFLLIYYANIPEESVYFVDRMLSDKYGSFFIINLIMNFFFPFLVLMTRDTKRLFVFLKIACIVILAGHWIDFYLMVTPGTLGDGSAFGLTEIGLFMVFGAAFVFVTLKALSKNALVAKNHPMLEESKHHHI
jgi:hypothetical protein